MSDPTTRDHTPTKAQRRAIARERRSSCRDAVTFLIEGDREGAYLRLLAGVRRQVRLAGLSSAVRDA